MKHCMVCGVYTIYIANNPIVVFYNWYSTGVQIDTLKMIVGLPGLSPQLLTLLCVNPLHYIVCLCCLHLDFVAKHTIFDKDAPSVVHTLLV